MRLGGLLFLAWTAAPGLYAQTTTLVATADSYLKSGSPNQNQGSESVLKVQSSGQNRALVRFDAAAIQAAAAGGGLDSARLELFVAFNSANWGTTGRTVDIHALTQDWTQGGVTWNCAIDTTPTNSSPNCAPQWAGGSFAEEPTDTVLHENSLTGWISFDVTRDVAAVLAGASHSGWLVKKTDEGQNGRVDYSSTEGVANQRPRLVLVVERPGSDSVPPRLAFSSPNQPVLVQQNPLLVALTYSDGGSGTNPGSLQVYLDGNLLACTAGSQSAACQPSTLAAGAHTLSARLRDQAGNEATSTFAFELLAGSGLHTLHLPVGADTYLRQGSPNQNQGAEPFLRLQQSGRNRALLSIDSAEVAALLSAATVYSARLELTVSDNGNNWGSSGRTVDLHRLTTAWTEHGATWNCPSDAATGNQQPDCAMPWNGGSFEPTAVASLLVHNSLEGVVSFDVTTDLVAMAAGGTHFGWLLKKTAESDSGRLELASSEANTAERPVVVVIFETATETDTTPPEIVISSPQPGLLTRSPLLLVEGSVSDQGEVVSVLVNGVAAGRAGASFSAPVTLSSGNQEIQVTATDAAGNQATRSVTVTVDVDPPSLVLLTPRTGVRTHLSEVVVSGQVEDAIGVAALTVAGNTLPFAGSDFSTVIALAEGTNLIPVVAVDTAGNSRQVSVVVERYSVPEVAITQPLELAWISDTTVLVTGTRSSDVTAVNVNGVEAVLSANSFTAAAVPLVEGGNILTARAVNALGRVATSSVSVVRDLLPPRISIDSPSDGQVVFSDTIAVQGLVNDLVEGSVNVSEATVTVQGVAAQVANRSFLAPAVPLVEGENLLTVSAIDESGNTSQATVRVLRQAPAEPHVRVVSGSGQVAVIGSLLPAPLVVELRDGSGQPVIDRPVIFKVRGNDGRLAGDVRQKVVRTDLAGRAQIGFTLGTRVGVGNQRVEASAVGFAGPAVFLATALQGEPALMVVDSGDQQVGVAGRKLPRPLVVAVTDSGSNRLEAVPVEFKVVAGAGRLANGETVLRTETDSDGRALTFLTLDEAELSAGNVVEARIAGQPEGPLASFVATGWVSGSPEQTAIVGIVLDNSNLPIPGVTLRVRDTALTAITDERGVFRLSNAPVGTLYLIVDPSTAERPGPWPDLEYVLTTVAGRDNDVGAPIYLVPLAQASGVLVDETRGGVVTLADTPGFALEIAPGSVIFPGGSRSGVVSATAVHSDKVPMVPNFGQQPRLIVTIQPAGARFDPPARMTLPNLEGLPVGTVTEFYSFDHDLGHFVSIGPATVSEDGLVVVSNPGVGVIKAGWQCGGNPGSSGTAHTCPSCQVCNGSQCVPGCSLGRTGLAAKSGCNCTPTARCEVPPGNCDSGTCKGTPVEVTAITGPCVAAVGTPVTLTAQTNAADKIEWFTGTGSPNTGQGGSFTVSFAAETTHSVEAGCPSGPSTTKKVTVAKSCGAITPRMTTSTGGATTLGNNFGKVTTTGLSPSFAECVEGERRCLRLEKFNFEISLTLRDSDAHDISGAEDPKIDASNCAAVIADLTPAAGVIGEGPPRNLWWSRSITEQHERQHLPQEESFDQQVFDELKALAEQGANCVDCQQPLPRTELSARAQAIWDANDKSRRTDLDEEAAHGVSNNLYRQLVVGIQQRAQREGWSCQ